MIRYSKAIIVQRIIWNVFWALTIRPFPRILVINWEIFLLRLLGAKIGKNCIIYPSAKILIPSYLQMEDGSCIANSTIIQNSAPLYIKERAIVSQGSYICCGTHDYSLESFPNIRKSVTIGARAWVAAQCFVGPGVTIGDGAVVDARAAVFKDVEPWTVVGGHPVKFIKNRKTYNMQNICNLQKGRQILSSTAIITNERRILA